MGKGLLTSGAPSCRRLDSSLVSSFWRHGSKPYFLAFSSFRLDCAPCRFVTVGMRHDMVLADTVLVLELARPVLRCRTPMPLANGVGVLAVWVLRNEGMQVLMYMLKARPVDGSMTRVPVLRLELDTALGILMLMGPLEARDMIMRLGACHASSVRRCVAPGYAAVIARPLSAIAARNAG